jgi:phosphohistidine phosphatase
METQKRELLILRHAKSAWDTGAATDFERPLAKRGLRDAPRMGEWMADAGIEPDLVVSSPATRARETAEAALAAMGRLDTPIRYERDIYFEGFGSILALLGECAPEIRRVMLVGHNPDLESLVEYLASDPVPEPERGKFFPTAALARLAMPEDWRSLPRGCARLLSLVRPKELA